MYRKSKVLINLIWLGLFLVLCLTISVSPSKAAVVFDSASSQGQFNNLGVTSVSWSHTVGTNPARVLYVSVSTSSTTLGTFPGARVTGVTYGGMALTPVGAQVSNSNRNSVEVYRLVNPPSGTGTIQVSLLAAVVNYVVGGGTSYSGVDQTTPNGAFTTARGNSTSPSVVVTDSAAGDLVLDTLAFSPTGGFAGFGAGQTLRWNGRSFFSNAFDIGGGSTKSGVSPVTMSWTISTMDQWVLAGIAIRSLSSTAANSTISGRILTEAGRRPISRTFVTLRNLETGEEVSKISNHFGYYAFENLETGSLYQIQVAHGRYEFSPDILIFRLDESLTDIDFIGSPQDYNNKYPAEKERFR